MDKVPNKPGESPIPEGHVRAFHYTKSDEETLRKQGLLLSKARGHTYGEPDLVWGSTLPPERHHTIVEFHVPVSDLSRMVEKPDKGADLTEWQKGNHHIGIERDLKPEEILAIHQPWHERYHYAKNNESVFKAIIAGEHDDLLQDPEYGPAIAQIKKEAAQPPMAIPKLEPATTPFVGSFAKGGTVPETGLALVHKGETVIPAPAKAGPITGPVPAKRRQQEHIAATFAGPKAEAEESTGFRKIVRAIGSAIAAPFRAASKSAEEPKPIRAYHGTQAQFTQFDPAKQNEGALFGPGFYFSENRDIAASYGHGNVFRPKDSAVSTQPKPRVIEALLNIRKPFDADWHMKHLLTNPGAAKFGYDFLTDVAGGKRQAREKLQAMGYDGITHMGNDGQGGAKHRVWIAFEPNQIKQVDPGAASAASTPSAPQLREQPAPVMAEPARAGARNHPAPSKVKANEKAREALREVMGRDMPDDEVRALIGAPADAEVSLSRPNRSGVNLSMAAPGLSAVRTLERNRKGELIANNQDFQIAKQGKGLGLEIFSKQVAAMSKAGVERIHTNAAGSKDDVANGYYTWPRMGYDGPLEDEHLTALPAQFRHHDTIQELMAAPGGREAWKKHGSDIDLTFDLQPGSKSRQVLEAYKAERAARSQGPAPAKTGGAVPFVGSFKAGGRVPQTGMALVHQGERVIPANNQARPSGDRPSLAPTPTPRQGAPLAYGAPSPRVPPTPGMAGGGIMGGNDDLSGVIEDFRAAIKELKDAVKEMKKGERQPGPQQDGSFTPSLGTSQTKEGFPQVQPRSFPSARSGIPVPTLAGALRAFTRGL